MLVVVHTVVRRQVVRQVVAHQFVQVVRVSAKLTLVMMGAIQIYDSVTMGVNMKMHVVVAKNVRHRIQVMIWCVLMDILRWGTVVVLQDIVASLYVTVEWEVKCN